MYLNGTVHTTHACWPACWPAVAPIEGGRGAVAPPRFPK